MLEIGPNLVVVVLAFISVLGVLIQAYFNQKHAELIQRQTNGVAAEVIAAQLRPRSIEAYKPLDVPPEVSK